MRGFFFNTAAALLATFVNPAATLKKVPSPRHDPFYAPLPATEMEKYNPGDIIRSRAIDPTLESLLALDVNLTVKEAHQYFYRTTDTHGRAVGAVTTMLVPHNANPTKLLSYQFQYDSPNVDCIPSFTLRGGSEDFAGAVGENSTLASDTPIVRSLSLPYHPSLPSLPPSFPSPPVFGIPRTRLRH